MEVILKQDIKGLGYKDDKVTVANGYGITEAFRITWLKPGVNERSSHLKLT